MFIFIILFYFSPALWDQCEYDINITDEIQRDQVTCPHLTQQVCGRAGVHTQILLFQTQDL